MLLYGKCERQYDGRGYGTFVTKAVGEVTVLIGKCNAYIVRNSLGNVTRAGRGYR